MFCFRCGKQVADDADYCPYCGARLEEGIPEGKREEKKRRRMLYEEPESIRAFSQNNGEILIRDEQKKHSIRKKMDCLGLVGCTFMYNGNCGRYRVFFQLAEKSRAVPECFLGNDTG